MNLRNLPGRSSTAVVAMVGIAGVVAVLLGVLSIREGFRKTLVTAGSPSVALVLRAGSNSEMSSIIFKDAIGIIEQAPGVARDAQGALVSPEPYVVVDIAKRTTHTTANVPCVASMRTRCACTITCTSWKAACSSPVSTSCWSDAAQQASSAGSTSATA